MATWANLTAEQRTNYLAWENAMRGWMKELQLLCNKAITIDALYVAQIQAILVDLDNNTIVPQSNNLAGAASLDSDAEAVTLESHLQGILTNYNTSAHQQLRAKAAGVIVGG